MKTHAPQGAWVKIQISGENTTFRKQTPKKIRDKKWIFCPKGTVDKNTIKILNTKKPLKFKNQTVLQTEPPPPKKRRRKNKKQIYLFQKTLSDPIQIIWDTF